MTKTPEQIMRELKAPFPDNLIQDRQEGGQTFYYISSQVCQDRLDEVLDGEWEFIPDPHITLFGDDAIMQTGRLYIPALNSTRGDTGTAKISRTRDGRLMDNTLKGVTSDCLKRCAMRFGVAAYLYDGTYRRPGGQQQGYQRAQNPPQQQRQQPPASQALGVPSTQQRPAQRSQDPHAVINEQQVARVRQLQEVIGLTQEELSYLAQEVTELTLARQTQASAASLIERLEYLAMAKEGEIPPTPGQRAVQQRQEQHEQRAQSVQPGAPGPPMTEAQKKKIYAVAINELQIQVDSAQFNDITVLHWGYTWQALPKQQASRLIELMTKSPELLDATKLPKEARMEMRQAKYWEDRVLNAAGIQEVWEILAAIKARYASMEPDAMQLLEAAFARHQIDMATGDKIGG